MKEVEDLEKRYPEEWKNAETQKRWVTLLKKAFGNADDLLRKQLKERVDKLVPESVESFCDVVVNE